MPTCKECAKKNLQSRILVTGTFKTGQYFPEFYDSNHNLHKHDENTITTNYRCTEGHGWSESSVSQCTCGWPDSGPFAAKKEDQ